MTSDGTVYAWGHNGEGQVGDGTRTGRDTPVAVFTGAVAIAAGGMHTLAVASDGQVWAWGDNNSKQLGDGTSTDRLTPTAIGLSDATAVAAGGSHSLFLKNDGTVLAVGPNTSGQIGQGSIGGSFAVPVPVPGLPVVCAVAAGSSHSVVRGCNDSVWTWGWNGNGALGDGTSTNRPSPVQPPGLPAIASIGAGWDHTIAIANDGSVFAWGNNDDGQLGDGSVEDRFAPVEIAGPAGTWKVATPTFSVASGTYGTPQTVIVATNTSGAEIHYTLDGTDPQLTDPEILSGSSLVIDESRMLKARAWKSGMPPSNVAAAVYTLQVNQPSTSPSAGTYTSPPTVSMSTTSPNAVLRYTLDGSTPTEASPSYLGPFSLSTSATVKVVGFRTGWTPSLVRSATYTLNYGTLAAPVLSPPPGAYTSGVNVSMTAMSGATIRYTVDGSTPTTSSPIYTWPLTLAATTTVKAKAFHPDYTASGVTTGAYTIVVADPVFALPSGTYLSGQQVLITSDTPGATITYTLSAADPAITDAPVPPSGLLTLGNFVVRARAFKTGAQPSNVVVRAYSVSSAVTPARVSAGDSHSLALRDDGILWGWGANSSGQVGDGTTTQRLTPVVLSAPTGVTAIAAGAQHTLAIDGAGALFAWGHNGSGRLGDGTTTTRTLPVPIGGVPPLAGVAGGAAFSVALGTDGTVHTWGTNGSGQLGIGSTTSRTTPGPVPGLSGIVAIAAGASHVLALTSDGRLYAWGLNSSGQLGLGTTTSTYTSPVEVTALTGVIAIGAGANHSLAVLGDGRLFTWGLNSSGQLGDNTTTLRRSPVHVTTLAGVSAAAGGSSHSVVLLASGAVYAMGANTVGQVGDGTTTQRKTPVMVAGLSGVVQVAARDDHSVALAADGAIHTWGRNTNGQLGDNTTTFRSSTVSIGSSGTTWILPAPTITPASGSYSSAQSVTISSSIPGAFLHYTLDGTEPTLASLLYSAPFSVSNTVTVRARAFKDGWTDSPDTVRSYTFPGTDTLPPTITAQVAPAANGAGWIAGAATVTFNCADGESGMAYCTEPRVIQQEGATSVTGQAIDLAGNSANTTVAVNVDRTPATVTVHAPRNGETLPTGTTSVTIRGNAMDAISGVEEVTCNGAVATLVEQAYACVVAVTAGSQALTVAARDRAGYMASRVLTVTVGELPTPTGLSITPASQTMLVGDMRTLRVVDEAGRPRTGGTWAVDPAGVAEVEVSGDVVTVRGVAAGEATMTLTLDGLTAEATVSVWAVGSTFPTGTTLGSLGEPGMGSAPKRGQVLRALWTDLPAGADRPALFFVDEGMEFGGTFTRFIRPYGSPTRIRATTIDGRELWEYAFNHGDLRQVAADNLGGVVVMAEPGDECVPGGGCTWLPRAIRRLDAVTGAVAWEYVNNEAYVWHSEVAIHPDGRVFVVEVDGRNTRADLLALDGVTGTVQRWALPVGHYTHFTNGAQDEDVDAAPRIAGPIIRADGAVVVVTKRSVVSVAHFGRLVDGWWYPTAAPQTLSESHEVQRVTLPAGGGSLSVGTVDASALSLTDLRELAPELHRLVPDGEGGLLLAGNGWKTSPATLATSVYRVSATDVLSAKFTPLGSDPGRVLQADYVLGEDGAWAYFEGQAGSTYWARAVNFDPVSLQVISSTEVGSPRSQPWYLQLRTARGGGGIHLTSGTDAVAVGAPTSASGFVTGGNASQLITSLWGGWAGQPTIRIGEGAHQAFTQMSQPRGDGGRNAYPKPFETSEEAALAALSFIYPFSHLWEWGGMICQQGTNNYWSMFVTDHSQSSVQIVGRTVPPIVSCDQFGPIGVEVARFHTHPPKESPLPSGFLLGTPGVTDITIADSFPNVVFYLMAPKPDGEFPPASTRILRYQKTPAVESSRYNVCEFVDDACVPIPPPE